MSKRTSGTKKTEASEESGTGCSPEMSVSTVGSVFTKASSVPGTVLNAILGFDVKEGTFGIRTFSKVDIEMARWHLGQVVFVQELAVVVLLTETAQPVLANHRLLTSAMTKRTRVTLHTRSLLEILT